MGKFELKFKQLNNKSILIEWPQRIDESILDDIISYTNIVKEVFVSQLTNYTPAFASLLLQFEEEVNFKQVETQLGNLYKSEAIAQKRLFNEWHIPVCYHPSLAIDIDTFKSENLDLRTIINLHTSADYRVYMIGFLPGFVYLGGLSENLYLPRKSTPSMKVPKGSIAIGGSQTGIYPNESPGGWHIIGRTPLALFDIEKPIPTPINQGDNVKFYEISLETYDRLL